MISRCGLHGYVRLMREYKNIFSIFILLIVQLTDTVRRDIQLQCALLYSIIVIEPSRVLCIQRHIHGRIGILFHSAVYLLQKFLNWIYTACGHRFTHNKKNHALKLTVIHAFCAFSQLCFWFWKDKRREYTTHCAWYFSGRGGWIDTQVNPSFVSNTRTSVMISSIGKTCSKGLPVRPV